ncbi:hypothetical protein [Kitasatospora sp. NPDC057198]|uniref:hypothetical protein n=1 Tax=Kitasatospora sp. NPDC057198 TaxID=3346046 RepID=UPI00363552F6
MKTGIDGIRRVRGTKYDAATEETADSLPYTAEFQKHFGANGWKVRACLLP